MKRLLLIFATAMAVLSCNTTNPFLTGWDTPYGIPDFTKIKESHYLPAVKAGIEQQQAEIDAIVASEEVPTFANVVEAYEQSGAILERVVMSFSTSLSQMRLSLFRLSLLRCCLLFLCTATTSL